MLLFHISAANLNALVIFVLAFVISSINLLTPLLPYYLGW